MYRLRYIWILAVLTGIPLLSHAQESVPEFYRESMQISNIGMGVLGGWALANIINGALDVAYMGTGLLLKHLAPRYPKQEFRLRGYGNSVILQGAFLFVFDLVLYGLHRSHRLDFLGNLAFQPSLDGRGLALSLHF